MKLAVNAVAQQVRTVASSAGLNAFAEQFHNLVEEIARKIAVGIRAAQNIVERIFIPGFGADAGDDLLHQHVDWLGRNLKLVELSGAHLADQSSLFEKVVASC